jgi:hypothetical protein
MSDKRREALELRAILVSTRAALRRTPDDNVEAIKTTATELLARLEQHVIRDGADPEILALIEEGRRRLWE